MLSYSAELADLAIEIARLRPEIGGGR